MIKNNKANIVLNKPATILLLIISILAYKTIDAGLSQWNLTFIQMLQTTVALAIGYTLLFYKGNKTQILIWLLAIFILLGVL